jgi:hypothetical protein
MPISRANLITGPARVVRGAGSCYTTDAIALRIDKEQVPIRTDGHGLVDYRDEDVMVKCTFQPAEWTAASRTLLYPYLNHTPGLAIFGATDTPTTIEDSNAHLHTIVASAVTRMPSLRLAVREAMFGACEITGVRKLASDWATPDSLHTVALTGGAFGDGLFTVASLKQEQYTGALTGITGLTAIDTEDGWTVDFETEIAYHKIEESGTVKATLVSISAMARCTPLGVTHANLMAAIRAAGVGFKRGQSVNLTGVDLVITGASTGPVITLKKCEAKGMGYRYGARVLRDNEVGFVATTPFTTGASDAQIVLA